MENMERLPHGMSIERDSSGDTVDLNLMSRLSRTVPTKRKLEDCDLEVAECPGRRDRGRRDLEESSENVSIAESRGRSAEAQSLDGDSAMREEAGNHMAELDEFFEDEGKETSMIFEGRDMTVSEKSSIDLLPLFVRTYMEERTIVIHALPSDTIDSIHHQIFRRTGLPVSEQRLIYSGRQLQRDHTLKECNIIKDASLNLVARMRSTPLPQSWQLSIELVNSISQLCNIPIQAKNMEFTRISFRYNIRDGVQEYLKMAAKSLPVSEHIQVFQQSGAAVALISLLLSSERSNQEYAEDCIRMFLSAEEYLSDQLFLYCAPIIVNFCKVLSRSAPNHDMYASCRTVLCKMLDTIGAVHGSVYFNECRAESVIADFAPFVNQLHELVIADLRRTAQFISDGMPIDSPDPLKEAGDLTGFLIPLCKAWAEYNANEATESSPFSRMQNLINKREFVLCENSLNLFLSSTTDQDSKNLKLGSYAWLDQIFSDLLKEIDICMLRLSDFHQNSTNALSIQGPFGLTDGYSHFLVLLRGLHAIANVLDEGLHILLSMLQERHVVLNIMIQHSVCTHGDYWLCEHKHLLNFQSKRKLTSGMLPEPQDDYEERHEIVVLRSQLLFESLESLAYADVGTLQGGIIVEFSSEEATGPGVLREWFTLICREIFNPNNALFVSCSADPRRFYPNPASGINPGHLTYFRFAGRVIALAIMHKMQLDVLFPLNFFKQLANLPMSWEDSKHIDADLYMHVKRILDMDAKEFDDLGLTFVSEVEPFGCRKVVELCPNGKEKTVNSDNRLQFVELLVQQRFVTSIAEQVQNFSSGFSDLLLNVTTQQFFQALEPKDFDLLLFGQERNICLNDWKQHTKYHGYSSSDNQIVWFWKVLEQMTVEQRKKILFFATAVQQLPVEGFSGLSSKFHIHRFYQDVSFLPQAHTCFYQLLIPPYPSFEMMNERFHTILQEDVCAGFGFP